MRANRKRIEKAQAVPYWVQDNQDYINVGISQAKENSILAKTGTVKDIDENAIAKFKAKYDSYSDEWEKAYFDERTGGFNVYHSKHQFTETQGGGEAEKAVGKLLASLSGKQVEFLPENGKGKSCPDLCFDKETWDVKYIDKANENTIRSYIKNARKADNVIFYYTIDRYKDLRSAINREVGRFKSMSRLYELPNMYYINGDGLIKLLWKKEK